jgi:ribosomal protein S18 acetylase RimI-like enzyme
MIYRQAQITDQQQIALLHADSWRRTYRGLFSDAFLDHDADADRLQIWAQRLTSPSDQQCVFVAEEQARVRGFICLYRHDDPQWGSLIDNLHVAHDCRRQGIGRQLMTQAFGWLAQTAGDCGVYLWVMENNSTARRFYETLGANNAGVIAKPNPAGGGTARNCRYVWPTPRHLHTTTVTQ